MIPILHRSADYLVVDKPAGLLSHRSELAPDRDVALQRARDTAGVHVYPLHRLDRQTSGVLVFALSEEAARVARRAFDDGLVEKRYVAIVRGEAPASVLVDYPIPKGEGKDRVPAVTAVRRLATGSFFSVVEARPKTGRYHQVRRHMAHLRHPLACDSHYGTGWFNRKIRAEANLHRLALHAASITMPTPNGPLTVSAPLAADLREALERLDVSPEVTR